MSEEDRRLWQSIKLGDRLAMNELYDRYIDKLYAYGITCYNNPEITKDAIHDLFLNLYKYRKRLTDVNNIEAYLIKSLKHTLYKLNSIDNNSVKIETIQLNDTTVSVEDSLIANEVKSANKILLDKCIKKLTNREREAINLKFIENKTYEEISDELEISTNSSRTLIYRALKKIKLIIEKKLYFFVYMLMIILSSY